jgi:hypothetical protein
MKLIRLCKAANSMPSDKCPALYVANDETLMASQGKRLNAETTAELLDLAEDEVGNLIPTETVLRATSLFLAAHGRTSVAADIESFVVEWLGEKL